MTDTSTPAGVFERKPQSGSYVAYTKSPSKVAIGIQVGDNVETVRVYPEVFVQEYTHIKVRALNPAERGDGLYVEFDPTSVPVEGTTLTKPINCSTQAGGPIEQALRWAMDHDAALYIGIEYRRKYKNLSGDVIPYDTPILTLRGFDDEGNSTDASQGTSRQNISKVLGVVGLADNPASTLISPEVQSDPLAWPSFRSNRIGKTPPPEWVRITRPDGAPGGAAVPRAQWRELTGTSTPGGIDINKLADAVAARLTPSNEPGVRRPSQRNARSAEGKRWEPYNSDGRVNPGSYAMSGFVATRSTALTVLEGMNYAEAANAEAEGRAPVLLTQQQISSGATKLASALQAVADDVQQHLTGLRANRVDGSSMVAGKLVAQAATRDVPMTRQVWDDAKAKRDWLDEIRTVAIGVGDAMMSDTAAHFDAVSAPTPVSDASGRGQREAARQNPPTDTASGPHRAAGGAGAEDAGKADHRTSANARDGQPAATPANRTVTPPATPDFTTASAATPVMSVRERNINVLQPLLKAANLQPQQVMPMLRRTFNVDQIDHIATENLADTVSTWMTDPARFRAAAQAEARTTPAAS